MTRNLNLSATEVALLTSFSSWVAILFNPIGGWIADRWGRVPPLIIAKIMAVIGALLVMSSSSFSTIIIGRFFVGVSYGMDFAVAMAMLAEFTPVKLKSRLNTWQGVWYVAVCLNLVLALMFYSWDVGDAIWRYSIAVTALCGLIVLFFQFRYLVESPVWLARKSRLPSGTKSRAKTCHWASGKRCEKCTFNISWRLFTAHDSGFYGSDLPVNTIFWCRLVFAGY